jgi:hypothetical protein
LGLVAQLPRNFVIPVATGIQIYKAFELVCYSLKINFWILTARDGGNAKELSGKIIARCHGNDNSSPHRHTATPPHRHTATPPHRLPSFRVGRNPGLDFS